MKCGANREEANEWLLQYPAHARAMAYIGRSGWNTLDLGGAIPDVEILEAVDTSYATVVAKLPQEQAPGRRRLGLTGPADAAAAPSLAGPHPDGCSCVAQPPRPLSHCGHRRGVFVGRTARRHAVSSTLLKVTDLGVQVFGPIHGAIFVAYLVSRSSSSVGHCAGA